MIKMAKITSYTDGVIHYGEIVTKRDKNKKKIGSEFSDKGFLFFDYRQIREEDLSIYNVGKDKTSNLKIETYFKDKISDSIDRATINGDVYEILEIDPSNDRRKMFWYLVKKGRLDEI